MEALKGGGEGGDGDGDGDGDDGIATIPDGGHCLDSAAEGREEKDNTDFFGFAKVGGQFPSPPPSPLFK